MGGESTPRDGDPEGTLRAFAAEMNRWGKSMIPAGKAAVKAEDMDAALAPLRAELARIFATYCTPRAADRPQGRVRTMHFGASKPDYDPDAESVVSVERRGADRATIFTRDARQGFEYAYVLVRRAGRWLIDSKKIRSGAAWSTWNL